MITRLVASIPVVSIRYNELIMFEALVIYGLIFIWSRVLAIVYVVALLYHSD